MKETDDLSEACRESTAGEGSSEGDIGFGLAISHHGFNSEEGEQEEVC